MLLLCETLRDAKASDRRGLIIKKMTMAVRGGEFELSGYSDRT